MRFSVIVATLGCVVASTASVMTQTRIYTDFAPFTPVFGFRTLSLCINYPGIQSCSSSSDATCLCQMPNVNAIGQCIRDRGCGEYDYYLFQDFLGKCIANGLAPALD